MAYVSHSSYRAYDRSRDWSRFDASLLGRAAIVALALRQVGRTREADALLAQADALLRAVYARGRVISWFEDDAAGIWALQGKSDLAINALERAFAR